SGSCRHCKHYVSPPEVVADDPHPAILFKAATRTGDLLYTCTQTEILVWQLPGFELRHHLSLPAFNDVHHVRPTARGTLLVANTGLDMVMEVSFEGETLRRWNVLGGEEWGRFSPEADYRRVLTTKPHGSHPNFVFEAEGEVWATRFEQRDALCLTDRDRRLEIGVEKPHDGIVQGSEVFFTTVDGHVAICDLAGGAPEIHDLQAMTPGERALGWCRGLWVLDRRTVLVGFSRLRPTRARENLRWLRHRVGLRSNPGNRPTRVALYNLAEGRLVEEWTVEQEGLNVLFSIHPAALEAAGS
ncbi:MAG: hypothetical protein KDD47_28765, partial [Acidobacteria bacterium]|nr:hypothetical protein [Acidobacteriota bacterium]